MQATTSVLLANWHFCTCADWHGNIIKPIMIVSNATMQQNIMINAYVVWRPGSQCSSCLPAIGDGYGM
jgi:hypothetical protein